MRAGLSVRIVGQRLLAAARSPRLRGIATRLIVLRATPPRENAAEYDGLERHIKCPGATMLVVGNVIGSGIFLTSGLMSATSAPVVNLYFFGSLAGFYHCAAGSLTLSLEQCIRAREDCISTWQRHTVYA